MVQSNPTTPATDATNRRKSRRVSHKPVLFQQDPNISAVINGTGKRKRGAQAVNIDLDVSPAEESSDDESDGEPDEEELKERKRKIPRGKTTQKKPAAKKPRIADNTPTKLAMRPASNGVGKPIKGKQPGRKAKAPKDGEEEDLYGELLHVQKYSFRLLNENQSKSSRPKEAASRILWQQIG